MNDADKILTRVDKVIDFDWSNQPPAPEVPHDDYSIRWSGFVKTKAGHYTFASETDDGGRLWIDGKLLVNDWATHPAIRTAGEIDLTEGIGRNRDPLRIFPGGRRLRSPPALGAEEAALTKPSFPPKPSFTTPSLNRRSSIRAASPIILSRSSYLTRGIP